MDVAPERYGSYLVHEQIGVGGMATVHRAEQVTDRGAKRQVALKRLLPTLKKDLVGLFLDESKLLRYLDHPNIAATYDAGRVFGTYFIAMEYVRGPTLKELVQHCGQTVGAVPLPITLRLAAQLCDALDYAHNATDEEGHPLGIIHRDVTPANIIISDAGLVKLIDFGLAKARLSTEETAAGMIKGKFGYIAPEYLVGQLDHRVDLWAAGIIMYELLTSRRLFDGPDALDTMARVRNFPIPRPSIANPQCTPEIDEIVMRALERNPARRWQTAAAMRDDLRRVIAQPDNQVEDRQVSEWVSWVLDQKRGRPPQLTPVMASPTLAAKVTKSKSLPTTNRPKTPTNPPRVPGTNPPTTRPIPPTGLAPTVSAPVVTAAPSSPLAIPDSAPVYEEEPLTEVAPDPFGEEDSTHAIEEIIAMDPAPPDPMLAMEQVALPPPPPIPKLPGILLLCYVGAVVLTVLIVLVAKIVG